MAQTNPTTPGSMAVSNAFIIYHMHWENKMSHEQEKKIKENEIMQVWRRETINELKFNKKKLEGAGMVLDTEIKKVEEFRKLAGLWKYI
jgi:hypothetical protein